MLRPFVTPKKSSWVKKKCYGFGKNVGSSCFLLLSSITMHRNNVLENLSTNSCDISEQFNLY